MYSIGTVARHLLEIPTKIWQIAGKFSTSLNEEERQEVSVLCRLSFTTVEWAMNFHQQRDILVNGEKERREDAR